MTKSIEKLKQEQKKNISYLRNRGNISRIVSELNIDENYIRKVIYKIKKQERRDVSVLISNTLMQHILIGYESRIHHMMEALLSLDGKEEIEVSICCGFPFVIRETVKKDKVKICTKCNKICLTNVINKESIYRLKKELIAEMREEDIALVEMAEKMGYTNKEVQPNYIFKKSDTFIVTNNDSFSDKDKETLQKIKDIDPMTREKIRKDIESNILDAEVSNIDGDNNDTK